MAGLQWMASDEEVLARSLGEVSLLRATARRLSRTPTRSTGRTSSAAATTRCTSSFATRRSATRWALPTAARAGRQPPRISSIASWPSAASWTETGATGPHLVSVILDGENAWENYANDGKEFLNNLYQMLQEEQKKGTIQTITPGDYVTQFPDQPKIEDLWAWQLGQPRLPDLDRRGRREPGLGVPGQGARRGRAKEGVTWTRRPWPRSWSRSMPPKAATGSGGIGADQNSGDDASFDLQFRLTLQRVYELLGEPVPTFLKVPVIPQTAQPPVSGRDGRDHAHDRRHRCRRRVGRGRLLSGGRRRPGYAVTDSQPAVVWL